MISRISSVNTNAESGNLMENTMFYGKTVAQILTFLNYVTERSGMLIFLLSHQRKD